MTLLIASGDWNQTMASRSINASEFKAECLDLLDQVGERRLDRITITKHGKPVAMLVPPPSDAEAARSLHGFMRGSVIIPATVDLTRPTDDEPFSAEQGNLHE